MTLPFAVDFPQYTHHNMGKPRMGPATDTFNILHWNTQGLKNKTLGIQSYLEIHKADFVCVNEVNTPLEALGPPSIHGYKLVAHSIREENPNLTFSKGGGTAIYSKPGIKCTPLKRSLFCKKEFGPLEVSAVVAFPPALLSNPVPDHKGSASSTPPPRLRRPGYRVRGPIPPHHRNHLHYP